MFQYKRMTVYFTPQQIIKLDKAAKKLKVSSSHIIRRAVDDVI